MTWWNWKYHQGNGSWTKITVQGTDRQTISEQDEIASLQFKVLRWKGNDVQLFFLFKSILCECFIQSRSLIYSILVESLFFCWRQRSKQRSRDSREIKKKDFQRKKKEKKKERTERERLGDNVLLWGKKEKKWFGFLFHVFWLVQNYYSIFLNLAYFCFKRNNYKKCYTRLTLYRVQLPNIRKTSLPYYRLFTPFPLLSPSLSF